MKTTIYPITAAAPYRISIVARPRGNDWLCDEVSAFSREGIDTLVSMLTDEEAGELGLEQEAAECRAAGIQFVMWPFLMALSPPTGLLFYTALNDWLNWSEEVATSLSIAAPA